jgi:hypothetical protein
VTLIHRAMRSTTRLLAEAVGGIAAGTERALPGFARDAATGAPVLAPQLTELADLLDEHIADEEERAFPVVRDYISVADFERIERMFRKGTLIGQLAVLRPWIADQCTPEVRAELPAAAGRPLQVLLRLTEGRYARRLALVRS